LLERGKGKTQKSVEYTSKMATPKITKHKNGLDVTEKRSRQMGQGENTLDGSL